MGIAGEGMGDQYRIGTVGIERSGGFVTDVDIFQNSAAIQRERDGKTEILRNGDKFSPRGFGSVDFNTSNSVLCFITNGLLDNIHPLADFFNLPLDKESLRKYNV